YEFNTPGAKAKMMNFEVRGWMTNHEAGIGTREFSDTGVPAAGLNPDSAPAKKTLGPANGMPSTIGNLYYGSKGYLAISNYDAYKSFLGEHNEPGPAKHARMSNEHFVNFIECVRSRNAGDLHAPIQEGYLSTTLIHLANASYRLGRTINFDPDKEEVLNDAEATRMLKGTYRSPFVVPEHV
ncbi:MAG: gfo/Idh/MocA family oxidoreductase, partial [Acidobacteriota bacterium]|nr:gfo/Idh/MocA family oxidoreductase [Acidobacteriota bacterium]